MRKVITILSILFILTVCMGAKSYKAKTKNNEVREIEDVVVEISETMVKTDIITIRYIDGQISELKQKISDYQNKILYWEDLRAQVFTEAEKVKLKP